LVWEKPEMLYVGNQTSCWTSSPTEPFDYALGQGFDAFEWFPDKKPGLGWDESDLDPGIRRTIRQRARDARMRLSVHARWQADVFAPEGYALLLKDLELARELGAALLNIHLSHERGPEAFVQALLPLIDQTAAVGVQLSIENTPFHSPEDFNRFFACLRAANAAKTSHVGMCLDLGHANLAAATRNDYLRFFDRLAPEVPIIHLHLHENWGDSDSHLPLFTGPAARDDSGIRGLCDRLRKRSFSGSAILEQWPNPPDLLRQARENLLRLWSPKHQPDEHKVPPASVPAGSGFTRPQPGAEVPPGVAPTGEQSQSRAEDGAFAKQLVAVDRGSRSWREKLDGVLGLLASDSQAIGLGELVDVAIYLRFLGTGQIACAEDGRHFRPASHARISSKIQERLAQLADPETVSVVRRIYPWLPSSAASFQRPEPLTRIRDIAHRNDIDQGLKREIKTTLQNKLHRCAGPEDLRTSAALLERVTAPGSSYSHEFVQQFKIFHCELEEFFNAQSLDQRLGALQRSVPPATADLIQRFLQQKNAHNREAPMGALHALTELRSALVPSGTTGELQESGKSGTAALNAEVTSELRLADIALEDFAFVLLSQVLNDCEGRGAENAFAVRMEALGLALQNLVVAGVLPAEAEAVEHELEAWKSASQSSATGVPGASTPPAGVTQTANGGREHWLRLHANLLRCRRLADAISERILNLFADRAASLGTALGIAPHAIRVFSESDLRSQLIFQISKVTSALLQQVRGELGLSPWDVLVPGCAQGRVVVVETFAEFPITQSERAILLLGRAAGDEEIPPNVAAIALLHELPHLSHLAVRARQAGVVLATCLETDESDRLRKLQGKVISLMALPNSVTWDLAPDTGPALQTPTRPAVRVPEVLLSSERRWISLAEATAPLAGGKADGARRLAALSAGSESGFTTPRSLVVPFGVMEVALEQAAPDLKRQYWQLAQRLTDLTAPGSTGLAGELRALVQKLTVPEELTRQVISWFGATARLAVRSSANCEDLEELAGAGLYDSVINVQIDQVGAAILAVWASLWTDRALLSRQQAGVPATKAHMAILIQEVVPAEFSFVLHTVNPITLDHQEVYAEVAVGLGDILVSATLRGSPYRLVCHKHSKAVSTLEFANFSEASRLGAGTGLRHEIVDYSHVLLTCQTSARGSLGRRLGEIGMAVERAFGQAQDIEGAVVKNQVYLLQSRPQQGIRSRIQV
jgi:phosphoglucan, water dikinase